jgi:hypothetical protein
MTAPPTAAVKGVYGDEDKNMVVFSLVSSLREQALPARPRRPSMTGEIKKSRWKSE